MAYALWSFRTFLIRNIYISFLIPNNYILKREETRTVFHATVHNNNNVSKFTLLYIGSVYHLACVIAGARNHTRENQVACVIDRTRK